MSPSTTPHRNMGDGYMDSHERVITSKEVLAFSFTRIQESEYKWLIPLAVQFCQHWSGDKQKTCPSTQQQETQAGCGSIIWVCHIIKSSFKQEVVPNFKTFNRKIKCCHASLSLYFRNIFTISPKISFFNDPCWNTVWFKSTKSVNG